MSRGELRCTALMISVALAIGLPAEVSAQGDGWRLIGGVNQVWFGGGVTDTTGGGLRFRPTSSAAWSVAAERRVGRVRLGVALSYLSAGLEVSGSGVTIVAEDLYMRQFELAALLSVPVLQVGQGAGFTLSAGPTLDHWTVSGAESRSRVGALGALQFAAPVAPDWKLLASLAGSVSGSPFEASELPVEFEPSTLLTGRVGFGIQVAF